MTTVNEDQAKLWNGSAGQAWVDGQQLLDGMFEPFERLLVKEAQRQGSRRVLDVGCGSGATTLAIARGQGADAQAVGVDISQPLITLARQRSDRERLATQFICADAQTHGFEAAQFELVVSRFGVMFFDDFVQAFSNLRRACARGAQWRAITFRSPAENPFMTTAERAAAPLLPGLPPRRTDAPGQFALADRARVMSLLEAGGWADAVLERLDVECSFPASALDGYMSRLGPVGLYLAQADEATRTRVIGAVRAAFQQFVHGADVRFTAACWMVTARNP